MNEEEIQSGRGKMTLPISDEDLAMAYGGESDHDHYPAPTTSTISYKKLFLTVVLAAPIATLLCMFVIEIWPMMATGMGLRDTVVTDMVTSATTETKPSANFEKVMNKISSSIDLSNQRLTAALDRQSRAIVKIANKKPEVIKVNEGAGQKAPEIKVAVPKTNVIVVKVPSREKFDLAYEKQKVIELSGVDLDDPITSSKLFDRIKSRDVVKELIRSFNAIIAAARDHDEVSDFMKKNALTAKKHAARRLKKLR
jgi:hypothetical protein